MAPQAGFGRMKPGIRNRRRPSLPEGRPWPCRRCPCRRRWWSPRGIGDQLVHQRAFSSSTGTGSARTDTEVALISAKPPVTTGFRSLGRYGLRMPGRRVVMAGRALHRRHAIGARDLHWSPGWRKASVRETRSNCRAPAIFLRRSRGEFLGLGLHFLDVANHVEGGFWQVVVFTGNHGLNEAMVFQRH